MLKKTLQVDDLLHQLQEKDQFIQELQRKTKALENTLMSAVEDIRSMIPTEESFEYIEREEGMEEYDPGPVNIGYSGIMMRAFAYFMRTENGHEAEPIQN